MLETDGAVEGAIEGVVEVPASVEGTDVVLGDSLVVVDTKSLAVVPASSETPTVELGASVVVSVSGFKVEETWAVDDVTACSVVELSGGATLVVGSPATVVDCTVVVVIVSSFSLIGVVVMISAVAPGLEGAAAVVFDPSPSGVRVVASDAGGTVSVAGVADTVNEGVLGSEGGIVSVVDRMNEDDELTVPVTASASRRREAKKKRESVSC